MDWAGLMRLGLHGLRLAPETFWRLTPVELLVMLGRDGGGAAPMTRAGLDGLIARYPDTEERADHGA